LRIEPQSNSSTNL